jgi:hypothetical protein
MAQIILNYYLLVAWADLVLCPGIPRHTQHFSAKISKYRYTRMYDKVKL